MPEICCFPNLYKITKKQAENQLKQRVLAIFAGIVYKPFFFVEIPLFKLMSYVVKLNVMHRATTTTYPAFK